MNYTKYYLLLITILSVTLFSCSDIQNDITPPPTVTIHGENALVIASPSFHGKQLVNNNMESCKLCHASDYSGGTAGIGCTSPQCHSNAINSHVDGIKTVGSPKFHGTFIANSNWNLTQCSQCHGSNYSGGIVSPACTKCHTEPGGPEACNTCHGDFNNVNSIAPPQAINNSVDSTNPGVGAHQMHLKETFVSKAVSCNQCHVVPTNFNSPGHIDGSPHAEVIFGSFASSGLSAPNYNFSDNKCSNTYCHGNFKFNKADSQYPFVYTSESITGNNFAPKWNQVDGSQGQCGTCHGLPPAGHQVSDLRGCGTCHQGIVDEYGNIIDKTKHMNGKINVFGN